MNRDVILKQIKETESNIRFWNSEYTPETTLEKMVSEIELRDEKKYLESLKVKLGDYSFSRIDELIDSVGLF